MSNKETSKEAFSAMDCNCRSNTEFDRRQFIALASAAMASTHLPVMAGPFDQSNSDEPIPIDKKLDAEWVKSLTLRGIPTEYTGWNQLKFIGMPIGGIGSGTVYLGGDGRLWCWDIFNEHHEGCIPNHADARNIASIGSIITERNGSNYVKPNDNQESPWKIEQGFVLTVQGNKFSLDKNDFHQISFVGQYPIATVNYEGGNCPVNVQLEAFSPFIPLDANRSSYPATVMRFKVSNPGDESVQVDLAGFLENAALFRSVSHPRYWNCISRMSGAGFVGRAVKRPEPNKPETVRDDLLYEDFEREGWGEWSAEGNAFAGGPFPSELTKPTGQNSQGHSGDRLVNSYNSRPIAGGGNADNHTGVLTSPEFVVQRKYVNVAIAGGNKPDGVFCEVIVDGQSVGKVTGHGNNILINKSIDVSKFEGRKARIRFVDRIQGSWAQLAADTVVFSDVLADESIDIRELPDYGSVALLTNQKNAKIGVWNAASRSVDVGNNSTTSELSEKQIGAAELSKTVDAGQSQDFVFVISWHFPNTHLRRKRWYSKRFVDAGAVADDIIKNLPTLENLTRKWRDIWYGVGAAASSNAEDNQAQLPHWLLERTLLTVDALQSNTSYRFDDGEFWAWEGVGCCPGTCTHVWHYAQSVGRLFPELERDLRERTDFGKGFRPDGRIDFRGGQAGRDATDGQAGVILRTYREHQMSSDNDFLKRVWPKCKQALEFLVAQDARDGEPDGIPVGEQHNTLDAEWFGKIPVLASLYVAALRAGEEMAKIVNDNEATQRFGEIRQQGQKNILLLFKNEFGYFVQEEDQRHLNAIGIGNGCYIDQVMGQWWAFNLGLGRLYDGETIRKTLHSLWDNNFCPDMGRLRNSIKSPSTRGRPYAMSGDAGLVMCTWPNGGKRDDWEKHWQFGYFNECMTGFEYQAAAHMIWESKWDSSLMQKGLAITRAIHDRYHASMRNPYNEIECSDHYARAMAGFSVFHALSGFTFDGPKQTATFDPRYSADQIEVPFVSSEAWGRVGQTRTAKKHTFFLKPAFGMVRLKQLSLIRPNGKSLSKVSARKNNQSIQCKSSQTDQSTEIHFDGIVIESNEILIVEMALG